MATNVVFNGVTYSVPTTAGESGWATTLSAYLQALASGAATTSTVKQAIRTAIASPVTVLAATDYTVVTNLTVPGAVAVNLPAGVAKQVFVIVDGKGDAGTNNVTIDANASQTINGALTYVINENYGGVMLQFDGTSWVVLAAFYGSDPSFTSLTVTTLSVTGTATIATLTATSGTVGGSAIVTLAASQTLTNKTLTSPVINTPTGIVKADVGLGNVDNTSDATKNAAVATLTNKTLTSPVINTPTGIVKGDVGLGNVDNTSDATKNAAVATLTNKTLTSPELDTPLIDDYFDINEEAAPGTPSAGRLRVYAKSDAKLYTKDDAGVEQQIGAGGSGGGVNYIANPLFADGTVTGWATYADAAATTPVDGTGGSPNVTFTAQSGSLVRGTFSGRLTKDAANRQGQGASYDFTIDAADTGRPVSIAFDFLASAAYVANDVRVFIYDVTNATLITPAAINVAAGKGTFRAFFVASTSTSYRLILHVASTNASAWTLDTDNFQVGPQVQLSGAPVTDWQSYTPTYGAGFGTVSTSQMFWRRDGDSIEIWGRFVVGTTAASSASFTLPSGLSLDTDKLSTNERTLGRWIRNVSTGSAIKGGTVISLTSDSTFLYFGGDSFADTKNPLVAQNGNAIATSGDSIEVYEIKAPISNWSSNVTMAERAVEEYASNNGTWNADDTTTFANGATGSSIGGALTTDRVKRVRFQTPIQATDAIILEVSADGSRWQPVGSGALNGVPVVFSLASAGTFSTSAGCFARNGGVAATDLDVVFCRYQAIANDDSPVTDWSTGSWRVRKVSGGAAVGYPVGARNVVGDTTGTAVPAGFIGEQIRSYVSTLTNFPASTQFGDLTSITLTPGVWDISSVTTSILNGATMSCHNHFIGTVAGNNSTNLQPGDNFCESQAPTSVYDTNCQIPSFRVLVTANTTYYLKIRATYSAGAPQLRGRISAVRIA